jgi:hypothetical protein
VNELNSRADVDTAEGQDRYLMAGPAFAAERQGIIPSARQELSFKVAPILGGVLAVESIELFDFVVIVHITGQPHRQVRDLPPGSRVTGFKIAPEPP